MKIKTLLAIAVLLMGMVSAAAQAPKREFRGAWIQCVNGQFQGMDAKTMQTTLVAQLDTLKKAGINAIIFQVRAEADALYRSKHEPWSRFLTGTQGKNPGWDPLQWMIDECHKRGMELHAWINPYRAKTKGTAVLSPQHPYNQFPERFVTYAGQLYFNPGLPENRKYICQIVRRLAHGRLFLSLSQSGRNFPRWQCFCPIRPWICRQERLAPGQCEYAHSGNP